jgi:hypothetical protein
MTKKGLTRADKICLLLRELILSSFSGRIELHLNQGSIRSVVKVETVDIAD